MGSGPCYDRCCEVDDYAACMELAGGDPARVAECEYLYCDEVCLERCF